MSQFHNNMNGEEEVFDNELINQLMSLSPIGSIVSEEDSDEPAEGVAGVDFPSPLRRNSATEGLDEEDVDYVGGVELNLAFLVPGQAPMEPPLPEVDDDNVTVTPPISPLRRNSATETLDEAGVITNDMMVADLGDIFNMTTDMIEQQLNILEDEYYTFIGARGEDDDLWGPVDLSTLVS